MRWKLKSEGVDIEHSVELKKVEGDSYFFEVDGKEVVLSKPLAYPFSITTRETRLSLESWSDKKWRVVCGRRTYTILPQGIGEQGLSGQAQILSDMPGRVLKLMVKEGQKVKAGETLLVVEAMKMENEIRAEVDAKVKRIHVKAGNTVESAAPLLELESL